MNVVKRQKLQFPMSDFVPESAHLKENVEPVCVPMPTKVRSANTTIEAYSRNPSGSKAVLAALRALQTKISTMGKEMDEMRYANTTEVSKLQAENADLRMKYQDAKHRLKEMSKVNDELVERYQESKTKIQQTAHEHGDVEKLLSQLKLENESYRKRMQRESNFEQICRDRAEALSELQVKHASLMEDHQHQTSINQSNERRRQKTEEFIQQLIHHNEELSNTVLHLREKLVSQNQEKASELKPTVTKRKTPKKKLNRSRRKRSRDQYPFLVGTANSFHRDQNRPYSAGAITRSQSKYKRKRKAAQSKVTRIPVPS